jgi:RAB protein geranylgeranyltransferase component A
MKEKRLLMRFIETCTKLSKEDDPSAIPQTNFLTFATEQGLPERLQSVIMYGILLVTNPEELALSTALELLKTYMISLGIYKDNSSVLYPLYGTSDISQGFCRTAAVYETIYVLNSDIPEPMCDGEGVALGENVLNSSVAYVAAKHHPRFPAPAEVVGEVLRCVVVSRKVLWEGYEGPVMLSVPPGGLGNTFPTYIYQVASQGIYAPAGMTVYYIRSTEPEVIQAVIATMFSEDDYVAKATYTQRLIAPTETPNKILVGSHSTEYFLDDCVT